MPLNLEELKIKIVKRNDTLKSRLRLAPPEELEIWEKPFQKLTELYDLIYPYLNEMTIEELLDFDKLYNMIDLIHDTRRPVGRERRLQESEILLTMIESNITILKKFIAPGPTPKPKKEPEEEKTFEHPIIQMVEKEKYPMSAIDSKLRSVKLNLDYFDIKFIFSIRDNPNLKKEGIDKISEAKKSLEEEYKLLVKEIEFSIPTDELREKWMHKLESINKRLIALFKTLEDTKNTVIPFNASYISKNYDEYERRRKSK